MNSANEHVFSHGMRDTRNTLETWNGHPWAVLRGWLALSVAIALTLLGAVWVVSGLLTPDVTPIHLPGLTEAQGLGDLLPILWRNSLVLALHATACVAGFIAGASMPIAAAQRRGLSRWVHVKAGQFAILFVAAVTLFSLLTQSLYLGFQGATVSSQLDISRAVLILTRSSTCDPRVDCALPAARRLADRQPPRRVEPAPGSHLPHGRPGDPDLGRRRRRSRSTSGPTS